tara:strand:+ start:17548 stop:18855 length:1308 start_codon:yes stop_codon:yes gene_type:complete
MKLTYKKLPYISIGILFSLSLIVFWPGVMRPDSVMQFQQALQGNYSDHHPPLMAFYWGLLNAIYPGPGLLLMTQMLLLWGAALIFVRLFKDSKLKWYYVLVPLFPPIFGYAFFILKDVGFTLCFLMSVAILVYHDLKNKRLSVWINAALFILLFYGTAVKFQAKFILPFIILWWAVLQNNKNIYHLILKTVLAGSLFFISITSFERYLNTKQEHSWQYVKLYDLAGISLDINKNLIPQSHIGTPGFTLENLRKIYETDRVDSMVFVGNPTFLKRGATEQERENLMTVWYKAIANHPLSYLKHRSALFNHQVSKSMAKTRNEILSYKAGVTNSVLQALDFAEEYGIMGLARLLTSFILYLPILLFYIFYGVFQYKKSPYARPLLMMNLSGGALIATLFIFSMASDARYIYFTSCMLHFSHPLAYMTWKKKYKLGGK